MPMDKSFQSFPCANYGHCKGTVRKGKGRERAESENERKGESEREEQTQKKQLTIAN